MPPTSVNDDDDDDDDDNNDNNYDDDADDSFTNLQSMHFTIHIFLTTLLWEYFIGYATFKIFWS